MSKVKYGPNYKPILLIFAKGSLKTLLSKASCPMHCFFKIGIQKPCLNPWVMILHRSVLHSNFDYTFCIFTLAAIVNWTDIENKFKSPCIYKLERSIWFTVYGILEIHPISMPTVLHTATVDNLRYSKHSFLFISVFQYILSVNSFHKPHWISKLFINYIFKIYSVLKYEIFPPQEKCNSPQ